MINCPNCNAGNIEGVDECVECGQPLSDLHLQTPATEVEKSLLADRISALAPKKPITVPIDRKVGEVLKQMVDLKIGCVIVVEGDSISGIFSERDALLKMNDQSASLLDRPVGDFMTTTPQSLQSSAKIAFAVQRMDLGGYRHIPIVDEQGQLTGIISVRDILGYLTEKMQMAASA